MSAPPSRNLQLVLHSIRSSFCCNVRICTRARTGRPGGGRRNPATLMRDPVALPIAEPRSGLPPRKVDFAGSRLTATIGSEDGELG